MVMAPTKSRELDSAANGFMQQSIRFAPRQLAWLASESKRAGESFNAVVRGLVDDAQTLFGLSPTIVDLLEEERAAMGLDFRRYIQEVLTQRYSNLLRAEIEKGRTATGRSTKK
jgi:hypothetical protein